MKNKIIKLITRIVLILCGIFLAGDGFTVGLMSNYNLGVLLTLLLGIILLLWGIFYHQIDVLCKNKVLKWFRRLIIIGLTFTLGLCGFIRFYGNIDTADYTEDVLIVLGAGIMGEIPTRPLAARLDTAVEYLHQNPGAYVIVTGGQGPQEHIPEAVAMERYLLKRGISKKRIFKEDQSTSTAENYKFSKIILDEKFPHATIATITNGFHIYRAKSIAKLYGIETTTLHAEIDWYNAPIMYLREVLAVMKLWVFGY